MPKPLQRVTRWAPTVRQMLRDSELTHVPVWLVLAQIHIESSGWPRPEDHVGDHFSAEGLLQLQPVAAKDCGVDVADIDGRETPTQDAIQSIKCWGKLQSRYVGQNPDSLWDHVLLWKSGSGTYHRSVDLRPRVGYWQSWWQAAREADGVTARGVYEYALKWHKAAQRYWSGGTT